MKWPTESIERTNAGMCCTGTFACTAAQYTGLWWAGWVIVASCFAIWCGWLYRDYLQDKVDDMRAGLRR